MKQGDIFCNLPYLSFDILVKSSYEDDKPLVDQSKEIITNVLRNGELIQVETFVTSTWGILASQDCDIREPYDLIFLPLKEIPPSVAKETIGFFNSKVRDTKRFFYLPMIECPNSGKFGPFHVQFNLPFILPYIEINDNLNNCWVARIREPSRKMLVGKLTHFFSRPPIDELVFAENDEIVNYIKNYYKKNKANEIKVLEKIEEIKRTLRFCGRKKDIESIDFSSYKTLT
jgi:hypothetical protein